MSAFKNFCLFCFSGQILQASFDEDDSDEDEFFSNNYVAHPNMETLIVRFTIKHKLLFISLLNNLKNEDHHA